MANNTSTPIELRDALNGVLLNSSRFNWRLYEAFTKAYSVYLNILFKEGNTSKDFAEFEKIIRKLAIYLTQNSEMIISLSRFQMLLLAIQI